jgi:hypothetical protein
MISMKILFLLAIIMLPAWGEDWTIAGKTLHNVVVTKVCVDHVEISFDGGAGGPTLADLSPELQKRFGYDPVKIRAILMAKEEEAKPDWQKIDDAPLKKWVLTAVQLTATASTEMDKLRAVVMQNRIIIFHNLIAGSPESVSDPILAHWIDCVMNDEICQGMPKQLVIAAWGEPGSKTTSDSGSIHFEMWNYGQFTSVVDIEDGEVTSITQTQSVSGN